MDGAAIARQRFLKSHRGNLIQDPDNEPNDRTTPTGLVVGVFRAKWIDQDNNMFMEY